MTLDELKKASEIAYDMARARAYLQQLQEPEGALSLLSYSRPEDRPAGLTDLVQSQLVAYWEAQLKLLETELARM